eukprot:3809286-Rhodomonas_salina.1
MHTARARAAPLRKNDGIQIGENLSEQMQVLVMEVKLGFRGIRRIKRGSGCDPAAQGDAAAQRRPTSE